MYIHAHIHIYMHTHVNAYMYNAKWLDSMSRVERFSECGINYHKQKTTVQLHRAHVQYGWYVSETRAGGNIYNICDMQTQRI